MSVEFDALTAQVTSNDTVEGSAVQLLQNISALLANDPTPAQVTALSVSLSASATALAAAIVANTPSAVPFTPDTPVTPASATKR
jgi:hypothetical protein